MILKDYFCTHCERVTELMVCADKITKDELYCQFCQRMTVHTPICNGGVGKRFRCHDFPEDPRRYRGLVEYSVEGYEGDPDKPGATFAKDTKGNVVHERPRFSGDKYKEIKDRRYHAQDVERGYTNLFCDLKRN